jgi:hypothetical protein
VVPLVYVLLGLCAESIALVSLYQRQTVLPIVMITLTLVLMVLTGASIALSVYASGLKQELS